MTDEQLEEIRARRFQEIRVRLANQALQLQQLLPPLDVAGLYFGVAITVAGADRGREFVTWYLRELADEIERDDPTRAGHA